jgi:hypothetical protein
MTKKERRSYNSRCCRNWLVLMAGLLPANSVLAQSSNEKTFSSPGDAALALYNAAKSNDMQAMNEIFG